MHKKLTISVTLILFSLVLTACPSPSDKGPDMVSLSDGLKKAMGEFKARTALLVNDEGHILATDDQGKILERCSVKPVDKGDIKQCRGLQKGAAVEDVNDVVMIKSKINPTCLTFINERGAAHEYCW